MNHSLSDAEIRKLIPDSGVMLYSDLIGLSNIIDIEKLLNSFKSKAICFLLRSKDNYGHWIALFLRKGSKPQRDVLHVFDPYGSQPDGKEWKSMAKTDIMKHKLGQDAPYLLEAILKTKLPLYFNDIDYQKESPDISTCGRHCVVRIWNKDLDDDQYFNLMKNMVKESHLVPDKLVVLFTSENQ